MMAGHAFRCETLSGAIPYFRRSFGGLLHSAAVDRALSVVTNPEHREALRQLQKLWKALAEKNRRFLRAQFVDEILLLNQLQSEISTAALH